MNAAAKSCYSHFISVMKLLLSETKEMFSLMCLVDVPGVLCVSVIQDQDKWKVKCDPEVCAYKGTPADLRCLCTYTPLRYNNKIRALRVTWFTKDQNGEPVDLHQDPRYRGRLSVRSGSGHEVLTIKDLRESDSAVYSVRLETNQTVDTSDASVSLTVTGNIL